MEKNPRIMDLISDPAQKKHILTNYLQGKEMNVNIDNYQTRARIEKINEDSVTLSLSSPIDFSQVQSFKLTILLARYIEVDCTVLSALNENAIEVKIDKVGIAKKDRSAPRIPVNEEGFIKITNIVSSKTIIDAHMFNVPTLVRVNFEEYSNKIQSLFDKNYIVSVSVFGDNLSRELEIVKKEMKIIFIQDTQSEASYEMSDDNYIHYSDLIDDQLSPLIKKYRDNQIISDLILPIVYINEMDDHIPIGYVQVKSKETQITPEMISMIQSKIDEMLERIKDANLIKNEDKFPVLDVSSTGLKLKVNHPKLTETLPKQKGFGFDIIFKMQSPFRLFATVAWSKIDSEGDLLLGLEILGKAKSKVERVRFLENIEILKQLNSHNT